jgi:hypothetical protein
MKKGEYKEGTLYSTFSDNYKECIVFLFNKNVKWWCMIKNQDLIKYNFPVNT